MEYLLLIPLTFLLGGLLLLLFMRPCPSMENAGYVLLTPEDAARQLLCSERILLLDVRDIEELEDFSLPRAHNVPLSMLADQIGTLAPRLSTPIFLCCDAGTRSRAQTFRVHSPQQQDQIIALPLGGKHVGKRDPRCSHVFQLLRERGGAGRLPKDQGLRAFERLTAFNSGDSNELTRILRSGPVQ